MRHLSIVLVGLLLGCASNPYGYAPEYVPLSEEESYNEKGLELTYEEVRRDPEGQKGHLVAWFGTVDSVKPMGNSGDTEVAMTLHFHQERHLCSDQFDSSCRVTISDKASGPFSARLKLHAEDRSGRDGVHSGSLLKIYGNPLPEYDERGGPILKAEYYRHWPFGTYVNTRHSGNMRR